MNKPELVVTPIDVAHIAQLIEAGADAFLIGEQSFGLRLAGEFNREQVAEAIQLAHQHGKKVYVAVNALLHNDKIDAVTDYLTYLATVQPDAVVFGDPAIIMIAREVAPHLALHWNQETVATNYYTANYWGRKGATRAVMARELNLDALIETKENAEVEIEVQIHGMTCMFQSKRSLLGNYFMHQGNVLSLDEKKYERGMFLHDKERQNKYPIFEDENGTHIMSPNDICMIDEMTDILEAGFDSLRIDGVLHEASYINEVTNCYRTAIDAYFESEDAYEAVKDELLARVEAVQPELRPLDTGFFFKETVY